MIRNSIVLILLISFSIYGHSQSVVKKAPDFKKIIHAVDTLALLPPFVDIQAIDVHDNFLPDTVCSQKISAKVFGMTTYLLKNKYSLKNLSGNSNFNGNLTKDFNRLFSNLNKSEDLLANVEFPDSIFQADNNQSRYCLMIIINGYYSTKEKSNQISKEVLPASIAVAVLTLGSFYLVPNIPSMLTIRIVMYDRVEKKVIFYKISNLSGFDVYRINNSYLNQVVMSCFKPIYYK